MAENFDLSEIISPLTTIVMMGFMAMMVGGMAKGAFAEHHSIHGRERDELVRMYGTWAVGRAESMCPEGDIECVKMEAARLYGAHRRAYT